MKNNHLPMGLVLAKHYLYFTLFSEVIAHVC